ncbi:MAG: hypothetical protein Q8P49_02145 [Candidatus Liptonbacteria bacterium]|nr:hypothetical protein [Candidatus Liptonbacteria bacterium]
MIAKELDGHKVVSAPELQSSRAPELRATARRGQAMILSILALGGSILGATTIAGLLMAYQIRGTTDSVNSAKAIFAADGGIECGLYNFIKDPTVQCPNPSSPFPNGASYVNTLDLTAQILFSQGIAATAQRGFLVPLQNATTTSP